VAPVLLGVPTIGGGIAWPGGGSGGSHRSQISIPSRPECMKTAQNGCFPALTDLKNTKNAVFLIEKYLNKIYSQDTF
jgi:hypothetical protein